MALHICQRHCMQMDMYEARCLVNVADTVDSLGWDCGLLFKGILLATSAESLKQRGSETLQHRETWHCVSNFYLSKITRQPLAGRDCSCYLLKHACPYGCQRVFDILWTVWKACQPDLLASHIIHLCCLHKRINAPKLHDAVNSTRLLCT